ncbi:hypothetical protein FHR72_001786 [Mycolicibacterium iranicum]|uniref:Uncharacterized protein n=1 Tax=Mycolicibacterium iranicum TaxID=912594 RepID=A0A839Q1U7_MYCIR|nr:hypothetical protein [Mycolicibacterium iranicum]MBB2990318.1 hypothetical protein [Mycolicibacterium iranicum]
MDECPGSGRRLPLSDQPSADAATCPVCGRETRVAPEETDDGLTFTIDSHAAVAQ